MPGWNGKGNIIKTLPATRQQGTPGAFLNRYHFRASKLTDRGPLGQGVGRETGLAFGGFAGANGGGESGTSIARISKSIKTTTCTPCVSEAISWEGVGSETAFSLAGHLKLSTLCWILNDSQQDHLGRPAESWKTVVQRRLRSVIDRTVRFRFYGLETFNPPGWPMPMIWKMLGPGV